MRARSQGGDLKQKLVDGFVRVKEGEWLCRAPVTIHSPQGAISVTPGVVYHKGRPVRGFDVAAFLDAVHASGELPPNVRVE